MQVQDWAHMQQPRSSMPVKGRFQTQRAYERLKSSHILWQLLRVNRSVLDPGNRFCGALASCQQGEPGFTQRPNQFTLRRCSQDFFSRANSPASQRSQVFIYVLNELDGQEALTRP